MQITDIIHRSKPPNPWEDGDNIPYLWLEENFWISDKKTAIKRYCIIDAESSAVSLFSTTYQAYLDSDYVLMLQDCGFKDVKILESNLGGQTNDSILKTILSNK